MDFVLIGKPRGVVLGSVPGFSEQIINLLQNERSSWYASCHSAILGPVLPGCPPLPGDPAPGYPARSLTPTSCRVNWRCSYDSVEQIAELHLRFLRTAALLRRMRPAGLGGAEPLDRARGLRCDQRRTHLVSNRPAGPPYE
jgi:hypothetical protein